MSAEPHPPSGSNVSVPSTVGGSKPLHRFMRGQPKSVGIVVLVLGCSFVLLAAVLAQSSVHTVAATPHGLLLGSLFTISGILYIVTAHNTSKKTVTMSLAMTIVSLLAALWTVIFLLVHTVHSDAFYMHYDLEEDDGERDYLWLRRLSNMTVASDIIIVVHSFVAAIVFTVMSSLGGAALRSARSQAVIVMTAAAVQPPVE